MAGTNAATSATAAPPPQTTPQIPPSPVSVINQSPTEVTLDLGNGYTAKVSTADGGTIEIFLNGQSIYKEYGDPHIIANDANPGELSHFAGNLTVTLPNGTKITLGTIQDGTGPDGKPVYYLNTVTVSSAGNGQAGGGDTGVVITNIHKGPIITKSTDENGNALDGDAVDRTASDGTTLRLAADNTLRDTQGNLADQEDLNQTLNTTAPPSLVPAPRGSLETLAVALVKGLLKDLEEQREKLVKSLDDINNSNLTASEKQAQQQQVSAQLTAVTQQIESFASLIRSILSSAGSAQSTAAQQLT